MDERRIESALNRIEAAFSRIEKRAAVALELQAADGKRDHELRERVGSVIAEIDELIAGLEK